MRELERLARAAEAEAATAAAGLAAQREAVESPVGRAARLSQAATEARAAADLDAQRFRRRAAWMLCRLAILAALLWGFYRIGYESGYLAAFTES